MFLQLRIFYNWFYFICLKCFVLTKSVLSWLLLFHKNKSVLATILCDLFYRFRSLSLSFKYIFSEKYILRLTSDKQDEEDKIDKDQKKVLLGVPLKSN